MLAGAAEEVKERHLAEPVHVVDNLRRLDRSNGLDLGVADQSSVGIGLAAGQEALVLRGDGRNVRLELGFVKKGPFGRAARGVADRPGRSSNLEKGADEGDSQRVTL